MVGVKAVRQMTAECQQNAIIFGVDILRVGFRRDVARDAGNNVYWLMDGA